MPEQNKDQKQIKMVPLSDLLAQKNIWAGKEKKWETEKSQLMQTINGLQGELKVAKANSDSEVDEVRKELLDDDKRLTEKRNKLEEDLNSHAKSQREFRAKEIASDLKSKGVEIDVESLLGEEDMEKHALTLHADFLTKENERLKKEPNTPESVFDQGQGNVLKKQPKDMDDKEFAGFWKSQQQTALAK